MRARLIALGVLLLLLSACSPSEEEIAAWGTETQMAEEFNALSGTATKLAEPSASPTQTATSTVTPTSTFTPTRTMTPLPSSTPTPPEGSAYVPDLVGMTYEEATEILDELGLPWYYVAVVLKDVPTWQIVEQSPRAGSLLDVENMDVKIVVAFDASSPPRPQGRVGYLIDAPCPPGLDKRGACYSKAVFWCDGDSFYYQDCSYCNGYCGFNSDQNMAVCYCP